MADTYTVERQDPHRRARVAGLLDRQLPSLARVGGGLRLVMRSPDGEEFGGTGEYIEIERPERLVYREWTWEGHAAHEGTNLVEVEFRALGDGTTRVILTNGGLPDEAARRAHREGWEASLDNLERVLEA
jgi:uncharacterized protein YndB with AHSA1/START domain